MEKDTNTIQFMMPAELVRRRNQETTRIPATQVVYKESYTPQTPEETKHREPFSQVMKRLNAPHRQKGGV